MRIPAADACHFLGSRHTLVKTNLFGYRFAANLDRALPTYLTTSGRLGTISSSRPVGRRGLYKALAGTVLVMTGQDWSGTARLPCGLIRCEIGLKLARLQG